MPVKESLREQYKEQQDVLAALKTGFATATDDDKPLIQNWIDTYESALADPAYQDDFDESQPLGVAEVIMAKVIGADGKRWHAEAKYQPGQTASYNATWYRALNDVAVGQQPDDVFDYDAGTGGWIPLGYEPPQES